MRLGHREDLLRTLSCPLLSLYLKRPLCIRGTNLLLVLRRFANFHKCLMKGAMSVKQIALACSGPPLSSNVLNACIRHVRIRIHANKPATAWADSARLIYCIIPQYYRHRMRRF